MVLLGGLRYCRMTLRIFWFWCGVNGFLTLDVTTEMAACVPAVLACFNGAAIS